MSPWRRLFVCLAPCVALFGCVGTETGNPPTKTGVRLGLLTSEDPNAPRIESAAIYASQLELLDCDGGGRSLAESTAIDLKEGVFYEVEAGDYCGLAIEVEVGPLGWSTLRAGAPDDLAWGLSGQTAERPFSVEVLSSSRVLLMPLEVRAGQTTLVELDPSKVLGDIDLSTGVQDNTGVVVIDAQYNPEMGARAESNWEDAWLVTEPPL